MSTPTITSETSLTWPVTAALRALAIDGVEAAKSGHPGAPMGMAEIAAVLWREHLKHDPADPHWPDRDRFVLSNGHASMLLYGLLHLTGYELPIEELKRFRQLHSKTPGHPEVGVTPGVETTTGPLGQGLAQAVGMAIAERTLAAQFNRPGHAIVDHRTYVFVGDGCLMEGISHEAASLAGRLKLAKLIAFYDDNGISIDGHVEEWFADDTPARFEAYGWNVIRRIDGHDPKAIDAAIRAAQKAGKPTLICCKTIIGRGAPTKQGTEACHGAPLGPEEAAKAKAAIGWTYPPFTVPSDIYAAWDQRPRGKADHAAWSQRFGAYRDAHPALAAEFERRIAGDLPKGFAAAAARARTEAAAAGSIASRKAGQIVMSAFAPDLPELIGGSADLTGSNLTNFKGSVPITREEAGNIVLFGVREFAMSAIACGLALHGGFIPFVATFLMFSDYARNAIRLSALMGLRVIFVFTHDSIALGEDGPTHQPIEHLESLRLIPNLDVWRPADAVETAVAWAAALERRNGPSVIALSRQTLPAQAHDATSAMAQGGYVLAEPKEGKAVAAIVATGSEVALAMTARELLAADGVPVRVLSMPCRDAFERLPAAERAKIADPRLPCIAVEAGATTGWRAFVGAAGAVIGIDRFGESAPEKQLFAYFELTPERIASAVRAALSR